MILAAIDPRIRLSFPAVMVSTAMQGGCTCENACLLRVDTGNVEFAALTAPRPQGLTTADDWTREFATKGFPQLRQTYQLLGVPDAVMLHRGEHFPHNYNAVARSAFHTWVNQHFKLGQVSPVIEKDYRPLPAADLTVWNAEHPAPKASDPDLERRLLRMWHDDAQSQLASWTDPKEFQRQVLGALEVMIGRGLDDTGEVEWNLRGKEDRGRWLEMTGLIRNRTHREELPTVFLYPKQWSGKTVIWLTGSGKTPLLDPAEKINKAVIPLLETGATVIGADLLHQGEFLREGEPMTKTPKVAETRESAAYTFGYNPSVFAQRVQDVLTLVRFVESHERKSSRIILVGTEGAGPVVAAARALCGSRVSRAAIETSDFRFGSQLDFRHPDFLPGGAKYGDLPGLLAAAAPAPTLVFEEPSKIALARRIYEAAGARGNLLDQESMPKDLDQGIRWLLE